MFTLNFSHSIYPEQQKTTTNKKNSQIDLRIYYLPGSKMHITDILFRFAGRDLNP